MTNTTANAIQPTFLSRFYTALIVPGLILFIVSGYFSVFGERLPYADLHYDRALWMRVVGAFIVGPLCILLGMMITRRLRGSVIGPALIMWGCSPNVELGIGYYPAAVGALGLTYIATALTAIGIMLAYFPTGQGVSPVWDRRMRRVTYLMMCLLAFIGIFAPTAYGTTRPNPFALNFPVHIVQFVADSMAILLLVYYALAVGIFIQRYRTTTTVERKQMRWLTLLIPVFVTSLVVGWILDAARTTAPAFVITLLSGTNDVIALLFFATPAIAIGNAVLRHKVYDIDIIIRRTLIYSVLTGILAVIYVGGVILAQQVFQAVTGDTPDIAIVLSTLLIAALFNPLRRRIQDVIDRRLYRRKYDVEQTIAQFNQTLRDEVDVQTLKANLIGVVSDTMQPDKIALWINDSSVPANRG